MAVKNQGRIAVYLDEGLRASRKRLQPRRCLQAPTRGARSCAV
jgi:hypothetical protein